MYLLDKVTGGTVHLRLIYRVAYFKVVTGRASAVISEIGM